MYYVLDLKKFDNNQQAIAKSNGIKTLNRRDLKIIDESQKSLLDKVRANLKKELGKNTPILEGSWVINY